MHENSNFMVAIYLEIPHIALSTWAQKILDYTLTSRTFVRMVVPKT
jgi:hypothetical protein